MAPSGGSDVQRVTSRQGRGSVAVGDGTHLGFIFDKAISILRSKEIYMSHMKYCSMSAL